LQLKDEIGYDLLYVADWLKRRRGIGEAEALLSEMHTVLAAMDRPQETTAEGALILDLSEGETLCMGSAELGQRYRRRGQAAPAANRWR
jgi:hypothetical protein